MEIKLKSGPARICFLMEKIKLTQGKNLIIYRGRRLITHIESHYIYIQGGKKLN